jgi:hypothetical protein
MCILLADGHSNSVSTDSLSPSMCLSNSDGTRRSSESPEAGLLQFTHGWKEVDKVWTTKVNGYQCWPVFALTMSFRN